MVSSSQSRQLKQSAVGTAGIVFLVVSAAAPLGATLGAGPVAVAASGVGAPGRVAVVAVVLLLFAVGYAGMSEHVTDAGGFTAFVALGIGPRAGQAAAGVALLAYNCLLVGITGQFGEFGHDLLARWGVDVPWQPLALAALLAVGVLGYLELDLSARVLGVLMGAVVLVLVAFDLAVITSGGAEGVNADAFAPSALVAGAPGVALLFAFTCFVGFEAATVYGEEAREPRRTVPRATYASVVLMGLFYATTTWAVGLAHGSGAVAARAAEDPVGFVTAVTTRHLGQAATDVVQVLVVTSVFAVLLALHNTLSRYLFALGRGGLLPDALGRTHPRFRSPHRASATQTCVTLLVLGVFTAAGVHPFTQLFPWLVGVGTLALLVVQTGAALAVVAFFRRTPGGGRWSTLVAPLLGFAGLAVFTGLAVANLDLLTGLTGPPAYLLALLIPAAACATLACGLRRRATAGPGVPAAGSARARG
ncbi:APC family permease [Actinosynnema sp.]|uniref:APC family permease n=1 Tax=Actinosynnema sp. TaxID=1872144 RepID=UPI003F851D41